LSKQTVAAAIICGDVFSEKEVRIMLSSLEGHIDEVFINYNGKKSSEQEMRSKFQSWTVLPVNLKKFEWEEDFSLARNQSFDMVPHDKFDWIMWIDTDDFLVVKEGSDLQKMFKSLDPYSHGVFVRYAYAVEPDTGIVVVEQWRERFLSTKAEWEWRHTIHEVCYSHGAQFARRDDCFIQHQRTSGNQGGARPRNRKIIENSVKKYPNESRYVFYMASELLAEADGETDAKKKEELADQAIHWYEKYRMMAESVTDDVYLATARMAELYRMKNDHANALQYDMECVAIYPDWPDAYVGAAKSCMENGDWGRMKAFADMASKCNKPDTAASIEPMMAGFTPLLLKAIAEEELGEFNAAIEDYEKAIKIWSPPESKIEEKIEELKEKLKNPEENVDKTRWDERKKRRGSKPDKSICFFTNPLPFVWHPKHDAGAGAERCIMELAPMFAADGWRVAVFGTPGEFRGVDENGVEWWNVDEFLPAEEFSVMISSRSAFPFTTPYKSKKSLLWMHDVNIQETMFPIANKPDKIVALTNWHSQHLQKLYGLSPDRLAVVPNGVHLDRFPVEEWDNEQKNPKFIWSSSADRGLDTLLSLWPMIRRRYEGAELHIFYGWEMIEKVLDAQTKAGIDNVWLRDFMENAKRQIELFGGDEGGIYQRGRVGQDELAKEMLNSLIWPYTTGFMETFCISAIEMQAAGVIPITSKLAALNETVSNPQLLVDGWVLNTDYQRRWLRFLDFVMNDTDARSEQRIIGRAHAEKFSWENSYNTWNNLLLEIGVEV
jgi:glycosyltransferase involved in cell wall biosynthesis